MGLVGNPVILPMHGRESRIQAKVALRKQRHDYRERATSDRGMETLRGGLKKAVKLQLKREGCDKNNAHDLHRATKDQLDRIEALNASWKEKIKERWHIIDLDP